MRAAGWTARPYETRPRGRRAAPRTATPPARGTRSPLRAGERLVEVGDDVVHVLYAHGEPDEVLGEVGGPELLGSQLGVRGGRRMDDEGLGIAHVGEVRKEPRVVDYVQAAPSPALDAKDHDAAKAIVQHARCHLVAGIAFEARIAHPGNLGVALEEAGDIQGVVGVALDA